MNEKLIELINKYYNMSKPINTILDLGCGDTQSDIRLIKEFSWISKIVAVDDDRDGMIKSNLTSNQYELEGDYDKIMKSIPDNTIPSFTIDYSALDLTKINFVNKNINNFLITNNAKFDLIVLSNVLHFYIQETDRIRLFKDMFEALNNDGQVYIQVASKEHSTYNEKLNTITFSYDDLIKEIGKSKFTFSCFPTREKNIGNWHFMVEK